jgi:hypothetical protein
MAELDEADARRLADRLFVPGDRWGWHYVEPGRRESPDLHNAPMWTEPQPPDEGRVELEARFARLDAPGRGVVLAVLLVLGLVLGGPVGGAIVAVAAVLGLVWFGPLLVRSTRMQTARAGFEARRQEEVEAFRRANDQWIAVVEDWDAREEQRIAAADVWFPLDLAGAARVDVVGGTPEGWAALLCTAGPSLLESGAAVVVADLGGGDVAGPLCTLAELRGLPVVRRPVADAGEGPWPAGGVAVLRAGGPREAGDALLREVGRAGGAGRDVLVVAGADRFGLEALEALARACVRAGVRLVLLLERLGGDLQRLLGATVTLVMRLGNGREAAVAVDHVGRGYDVVLTRLPRASGAGVLAPPADGEPAVHEVAVEPAVVQSLDATSFVLLEAGDGRHRVVGGTCDPYLALLPRVGAAPAGAAPATPPDGLPVVE